MDITVIILGALLSLLATGFVSFFFLKIGENKLSERNNESKKIDEINKNTINNGLDDFDISKVSKSYIFPIERQEKELAEYYTTLRNFKFRYFLGSMALSILGSLMVLATIVLLITNPKVDIPIVLMLSISSIILLFFSYLFFMQQDKLNIQVNEIHKLYINVKKLTYVISMADKLPSKESNETKRKVIEELMNLNVSK